MIDRVSKIYNIFIVNDILDQNITNGIRFTSCVHLRDSGANLSDNVESHKRGEIKYL